MRHRVFPNMHCFKSVTFVILPVLVMCPLRNSGEEGLCFSRTYQHIAKHKPPYNLLISIWLITLLYKLDLLPWYTFRGQIWVCSLIWSGGIFCVIDCSRAFMKSPETAECARSSLWPCLSCCRLKILCRFGWEPDVCAMKCVKITYQTINATSCRKKV